MCCLGAQAAFHCDSRSCRCKDCRLPALITAGSGAVRLRSHFVHHHFVRPGHM